MMYKCYKMHDKNSTSQIRQQLRALALRLSSRLESLTSVKGPLVQGAFQINGTTCGNPNCKCARGELHPTAILVISEKGKRKNLYVPATDRPEIQRRNQRYQRWRKARADLVKLNSEFLVLADALMEALAETYVPKRKERSSARTRSKKNKGATPSRRD
jgi:hypothetical protein